MNALTANDEDAVLSLMQSTKISVNNIMSEIKKTFENLDVVVSGNSILVDGYEMGGFLISRINDLRSRNLPFDHLINFLKRAFLNPKKFVLEEMFEWIDRNDMPITDDGYFLAYKRVTMSYMDCYTGKTFDNSVGNHVVFPTERRTELVDRNQECSGGGLHICAFSYLGGFHPGERVVVVKVDPQHVYSFPKHGGAKMQVFEYDVISEIEIDRGDRIPSKIVSTSEPIEQDDEDETSLTPVVSERTTIESLASRFSFTVIGSFHRLYLFRLRKGDTAVSSSQIVELACRQHPGIKDFIKFLEGKLAVSDIGSSLKTGRALASDKYVYLTKASLGDKSEWRLKVESADTPYDLFEVRL
jgi:hypothetical protein